MKTGKEPFLELVQNRCPQANIGNLGLEPPLFPTPFYTNLTLQKVNLLVLRSMIQRGSSPLVSPLKNTLRHLLCWQSQEQGNWSLGWNS